MISLKYLISLFLAFNLNLEFNLGYFDILKIKENKVKDLKYEDMKNVFKTSGFTYVGKIDGYYPSDINYNWNKGFTNVSFIITKGSKPFITIDFPDYNKMKDASNLLGFILFSLGEDMSGVAEIFADCAICNLEGKKNCKCNKKLKKYNVLFLDGFGFPKKAFSIFYN